MPKISQLPEQKNNIHHKWDDDDYIERLKVDNHESYTQLTKGLGDMCKGMSLEDLNKKIGEIERAHEHVSNSLEAQKLRRNDKKISEALKKTAYTKGLLSDQIEIAKSHREKLLKEQNLKTIDE